MNSASRSWSGAKRLKIFSSVINFDTILSDTSYVIETVKSFAGWLARTDTERAVESEPTGLFSGERVASGGRGEQLLWVDSDRRTHHSSWAITTNPPNQWSGLYCLHLPAPPMAQPASLLMHRPCRRPSRTSARCLKEGSPPILIPCVKGRRSILC